MARKKQQIEEVEQQPHLSFNLVKTASTVGAIATIIGAGFLVDDRYVHAEDLQKFEARTQSLIKESNKKQTDTFFQYKKQQIEDELFILDSKKQLTPTERALRERYKNRLSEIDKAIRENNRQ